MKQKPRNTSRTSRTPRPGGPPRPKPSPAPQAAPVAKPAAPPRVTFEVSACDCDDCRAACLNSPGWFVPDQIPRLARHLDLTVEETFRRYLAVGVTQLPNGTERRGVMPHKLRDGKKPGSRWTLAELARPGRCVFYDHGRCSIHPVRPYECARMRHDKVEAAVHLRRLLLPRWTEAALAPFLALCAGGSAASRRRGKP